MSLRKSGLNYWYKRITKIITFHLKGEEKVYGKCPQNDIIIGVEGTKTKEKQHLMT